MKVGGRLSRPAERFTHFDLWFDQMPNLGHCLRGCGSLCVSVWYYEWVGGRLVGVGMGQLRMHVF